MDYTTTYDQITKLIKKSQNILILTHARADCDGLGAALSAYLALKEMGKKATVVTNDPTPENLQFLPSIDILSNSLAESQDFIITVDSENTQIGKIKYNVEGNKVNIIISPKEGTLSAENISFSEGNVNYDLILVLDTGNLEHLGALYENNVEMFYETPIINMDHHASNTDFGQVNLVDSTAASATEILFEYLSYLEKKENKRLITEDVATLLLAGIITDTGSFQHANTSPRAMETSAKLLDLGARQQEVIKNIYKTKKLSTLKLWGIILSKVQVDPVHRMVWSTLSTENFQEAGAETDETEGIIDDLLTNAPGAEVIFLIKQNPEYVSVSMRSTSNRIDVGKFCADNGGGGHVRAAGFKIHNPEQPFDQVVSDVISRVQNFQAERLSLNGETGQSDNQKAESVMLPSHNESDDSNRHLDENPRPQEKDSVSEDVHPHQTENQETYLDFDNASKEAGETEDQETNLSFNDEQTENQETESAMPPSHNESQDETSPSHPADASVEAEAKTEENIGFDLSKPAVDEQPGNQGVEKPEKDSVSDDAHPHNSENTTTPSPKPKRRRRRRKKPSNQNNNERPAPQNNPNPPQFPTPPPIIQ